MIKAQFKGRAIVLNSSNHSKQCEVNSYKNENGTYWLTTHENGHGKSFKEYYKILEHLTNKGW